MNGPPDLHPPAQAVARREDEGLQVEVSGRWRITAGHPRWREVARPHEPARVTVTMAPGTGWDSALVLFVYEARIWCEGRSIPCDLSGLPPDLLQLAAQLQRAPIEEPKDRTPDFLSFVGLAATDAWSKSVAIIRFIGEVVISVLYLAKHPQKFRWRDCLHQMQLSGAMGLPIVGVISLLVGVTLAYTGAIILRQFGGDIWVADLVGLSMTREMAAVMTGIVLAGRTGAAFAAEIGNMKAGEEIDALETLGIRPVDFLVIPRMVALGLMTPLLALYANALGIFGGMIIAFSLLNIPPTAYWVELLTAIDLSDIGTGIIKAFTFGGIVGLAGCLRGLQADRSAAGVGQAATSAVVTAILLIIVADALFAVIFNAIDW